jgi:hypothetical protein
LKNGEKPLYLTDILEIEQIHHLKYDIGVPIECALNHLKVNYYDKNKISIVFGKITCRGCCHINNLVFDNNTYTFHTIPFSHNIHSMPTFIIWTMMYINEWMMISYDSVINDLVFYNCDTFENIVKKSWGLNQLSILPRNQCHIFSKSLKSIISNTADGFTYIMSYYRHDQFCFINKKLKSLFPGTIEALIRFHYPPFDGLEGLESWEITNNYKRRIASSRLKRFSIST